MTVSNAMELFLREISLTNSKWCSRIPHLLYAMYFSWGSALLFSAYILSTTLIYLTKMKGINKSMLMVIELLSFFIPLASFLLPFKSFRFFYGLVLFCSFMAVHSSVCAQFYRLSSVSITNYKDNTKDSKDKSVSLLLYESMLEAILLVRRQHITSTAAPKCSLQLVLYLLYVAALTDVATYIRTETIPRTISTAHQEYAVAIVGGLWSLYCMDFSYSLGILLFDAFGKPIPFSYRHCHPLTSSSLSEFWGVRWNPIVSKLLQDAFYIPLKNLKCSRFLCISSCFLGSAVLHGLPQYLSTRSAADAAKISLFFLIQGGCVMVENTVVGWLGHDKYFNEYVMIHADSDYKRAAYQWLIELSTVSSIILILYSMYERNSDNVVLKVVGCVGLALWTIASYVGMMYNVGMQLHRDRGALFVRKLVLYKTVGWLYSLCILVTLLPIFSLPVIHAVDTLYTHSFVVGSLVRSIYSCYNNQCYAK